MNNSKIGGYLIKDLLRTTSKTLIYRVEGADGKTFIAKLPLSEMPESHEIERYEWEYVITQKVNNPNVAKAVDYVKVGNKGALILEECTGKDLSEFVDSKKVMPLSYFLDIAVQTAKGLQAIHAAGIVHLDINPSNLMTMQDEKTLKIIDFGIAKDIGQGEGFDPQNKDFEGSLPYVSPEQTGAINRMVDHRSDLYSLGITFYEMLTGVLPFQFEDRVAYIHAHIAREAISLCDIRPDVPKLIGEIVQKLMNKNAEDRYQSSFGLLEDLLSCQAMLKEGKELKRFVLGSADQMDRIDIGSKLLGRDEGITNLGEMLEKIHKGKFEAAIVFGAAGCGKTSLAMTLQKTCASRKQLFAVASFTQNDMGRPFAPLIRAIDRIFVGILADGKKSAGDVKTDILSKLGKSAGIICHLIPNVRLVVGDIEEPSLDPKEKKLVTLIALRDLLEIIAKRSHGMVVVFDNLNSADDGSVDFLEYLITRSPVGGLLLVGTYRTTSDNAADDRAKLMEKLAAHDDVKKFDLAGLSGDQVEILVANALHANSSDVEPLARTIFQKTQGNPLFVGEFLKSLYKEKALTFSYEERLWRWDEKKIANMQVSVDIADFISQKFISLSEQTKQLLANAAIIGSEFLLGGLAELSECSAISLFSEMASLLAHGIISCTADDYTFLSNKTTDNAYEQRFAGLPYRFVHEKVFQQSYDFLESSQRCALHLKAARLMMLKEDYNKHATEIIRHYVPALKLVTEAKERWLIVALCYQSALDAKNSSAFTAAYEMLVHADTIIGTLSLDDHRDLTVHVKIEYFECAFLAGKNEESEHVFKWLQATALDSAMQLKLFEVRSFQLATQGKLEESMQYGIEVFHALGIDMIRHPSPLRFLKKLLRIKRIMKKHKIADLINYPLMTDPKYLTAMKVSTYTTTSAMLSGSRLFFADISMIRMLLTLTYGIAPMSPSSLVGFSLLNSHKLHNPEDGKAYGELALDIIKKYPNQMQISRAIGSYVIFCSPWNTPISKMRELFRNWMEACMQEGDIYYLGQAAAIMIYYPDDIKASELPAMFKKAYEALVISSNPDAYDIFYSYKFFWDRVIDDSVTQLGMNHEIPAESFIEALKQRGFHSGAFMFYTAEMKLAYLRGEYNKAKANGEMAAQFIEGVTGAKSLVDYYSFTFFTFARLYPKASKHQRKVMMKEMKKISKFFTRFARIMPSNFEFIRLLLEAELARLAGKGMEITQGLFDKALSAAESYNHMWGAIANVILAKWHQESGREKIALLYVEHARYFYERVGAKAIVSATEEMFGGSKKVDKALGRGTQHRVGRSRNTFQIDTMHTTTTTSDLLNYEDLFNALQQLSQESSFEKFVVGFAKVVLEYSGGQRLGLVLKNVENGQLFLALNCSIGSVNAASMIEEPVRPDQVPIHLLQYVERSLETVILDEACQDSDFIADQYISSKKVLSALATPLMRSGQLVGIIYLENAGSKGAFTQRHEQIVHVLAHQAASTIQSSLLQRDLEHKVKQKTRDMVMMMQHMKQGIFMIGKDSLIEDGASHYLSEIMGTEDIAKRDAVGFLFSRSNIGSDHLGQMKTMTGLVGERMLSYEVNQHILVNEFTRKVDVDREQILEVDWDPILDEDQVIGKIMVTVRDVTRLRELERQAAKSREELEVMLLLQNHSAVALADFHSDFERLSGDLASHLPKAENAADGKNLDVIFRIVHTQKGLSRSLEFFTISNLIHAFEEKIGALRGKNITVDDFYNAYQIHQRAVAAAFDKFTLLYQKFFGNADTIDISVKDVATSLREILSAPSSDRTLRADLEMIVNRMSSVPLPQIVAMAGTGLERAALNQGKKLPNIAVLGENMRFFERSGQVLKGILVHLLTNSVDHGIELPSLRVSKGKSEAGTISIEAKIVKDQVVITLQDDGAGLNLDRIKAKGEQLGYKDAQKADDSAVAELIFAPVLSTAQKVSDSSGRGVGMDAVRAMLKEIGGSIGIEFTGEKSAGCRTCKFVLQLPRQCIVADEKAPMTIKQKAA